MAKVSFRLVMPERELLATEADMVVVPGSEGGKIGRASCRERVSTIV